MNEIEITKENFVSEVLKSNCPVLLDFWAEWCGPCMLLSPVISEIAESHDEIKVGKVNVDLEPELAETFSVDSIPALFVVKDGQITAKRVGYQNKNQIEGML